MLAIRGGRPELLNLKDIIEAFVRFREEVITRRTKFELDKAASAPICCSASSSRSPISTRSSFRNDPGIGQPAGSARGARRSEWSVAEIRPYIGLVEAVEPEASAR